jgi:uncharacterized protein YndB with AHSA1/START domain
MYGTLEETPDGPRLRFVRHLPHPPAKVWRALTEPDELAKWFPGGKIDGEITERDEERVLEFRWGGTDLVRFELEPDGDGTRLMLLDTLEALGKAARDGAGWHVCLDELEHALDGSSADSSTSDQWRAVHPRYVNAFGPEAATIGPPEGALED